MHTNPIDTNLIPIVARVVFDLKSVNLHVNVSYSLYKYAPGDNMKWKY